MARAQHHDRTDKLAEAHDRLAQAVEALVSSDDWQAFPPQPPRDAACPV